MLASHERAHAVLFERLQQGRHGRGGHNARRSGTDVQAGRRHTSWPGISFVGKRPVWLQGTCIAMRYKETHRRDGVTSLRMSLVLLTCSENVALWHYLHETGLSHWRSLQTNAQPRCNATVQRSHMPLLICAYAKAVSSTIISTNPVIRPAVANASWPLRWDSGMISWLMTNSMAPAAKPRPQGRSRAE